MPFPLPVPMEIARQERLYPANFAAFSRCHGDCRLARFLPEGVEFGFYLLAANALRRMLKEWIPSRFRHEGCNRRCTSEIAWNLRYPKPAEIPGNINDCGCNSVGRVLASQAGCRGFESHHPLFVSEPIGLASSSPCWLKLPFFLRYANQSPRCGEGRR